MLCRDIEEEIYGRSAAEDVSGPKLDFLPNTVTKMSSIACVITVSLRTDPIRKIFFSSGIAK
jgi:hypothetical protein